MGTIMAADAKTKILVVDDDPVSLRVFTGFLEKEGFEPITAATGHAALEAIQAEPPPDLVILDVVLPDVDGIVLCQHLKADARTEHIPILLVSAFRKDDTSIRDGLAAGAEGYLLKPIEEIALRAWVKAALRISALQRELSGRRIPSGSTYREVLQHFVKLSHAVNNSLQALYATVDILSLTLPKDERTTALTVDILHHAERVAQMVAQASIEAKALLTDTDGHGQTRTDTDHGRGRLGSGGSTGS